MPNWCENKLIALSTNKEQLKEVHDLFDKVEEGVFEKITPTPKELLESEVWSNNEEKNAEMMAKYGSADWYMWRISNWGTKWDINETHSLSYHEKYEEMHDGRVLGAVITGFDTAWAPPEEMIYTMSIKYPEVYFHLSYEEPGMAFAGCYAVLNGEVKDQTQTEMYSDVDRVMNEASFYFEIATGE